MNSTDDSYSMTCSLPSSLEQTPISSLSAASSYSSLVNCDEVITLHDNQQPYIEKKITRTNTKSSTNRRLTNEHNNINKRLPYSTLLHRHINKLCSILEQPVEIHGQGNFPTLNIVPKDFLIELKRAFHSNHIDFKDIRLNGGTKIIDFLKVYLKINSRCGFLCVNQ